MTYYLLIMLIILLLAFLALLRYGKEYDKRFGKCSAKYVLGQLIITIFVLAIMIVFQIF